MNVKPLLRGGLKTAFRILSDLNVPAVLKLGRTVEVDPETDKPTSNYLHTVQIKGIKTNIDQNENGVWVKKQAFIIQAADLPAGVDLNPGEVEADSDDIEIAGEAWNIYEVRTDSAGVSFTLLIRNT